MLDHLDILVTFPTVLFSVPMGFVIVYWIMAIVGAVDLEIFDALDGGIDGAIDGALDGAVDGAVDGAMDAAMEAAADGTVDAAFDAAAEGIELDGSGGMLLGLAGILRLGRVPATIPLSLFVVWGWATSMTLMLMSHQYEVPFAAFLGVGVLVLSIIVALALTNISVRPLEPLFHFEPGRRRHTLIGDECEIMTGKVTATFGQAEITAGNDHLLIQVRCTKTNGLARGSRALIVSWDDAADAFIVEPFAPSGLLEDRGTP